MSPKRPGSRLSKILARLGEIAISPRWRKVISDLKSNMARTILVILSIAVGVFAVGFVSGSFSLILEDMDKDYQSANAHAAIIFTDLFNDDLLVAIRGVNGVEAAEGRSSVNGQVYITEDKKVPIQITGLPPVVEMKIDLLKPTSVGEKFQLKDKEIFIEQSALKDLIVKPGDIVQVEEENGKKRELTVAGIVHDVSSIPYGFTGSISAYVNQATIEWLGGSDKFNTVYLTVTHNKTSQAYVEEVTREVTHKIEKSGTRVFDSLIYQPGRHFASDITKALGQIMSILGGLSVFLSAFLVINTISSLLTQQMRQIGILKAIGARTDQVIAMYLVLVILFGLLAFGIAMPLSAWLGYRIAGFIAGFLNFQLLGFRIPFNSLLQEIFVAFIIPTAAALYPVLQGSRMTIREAISSYGLGRGRFGKDWIDRLLGQIKWLSRPMLISLRNIFRRKGRLFLTLSTLTLAGAIFIAVINLKAAFDITVNQTLGYFLSDVVVDFNHTYRYEQLAPLIFSTPNVVSAKSWGEINSDVLSPDKKTSTQVQIIAPPASSKLIKPVITSGRWLVPGDENALVIGNHLLKVRPDLKVGDRVDLKINDKEYEWQIVGTYKMAGNTPLPPIYTNAEYLAKVTHHVTGQVNNLRVVTYPQDAFTQTKVSKMLGANFAANGISVSQVITGSDVSAQNSSQTAVLVYFLLVMAVLIALVGGLGLSGTMGMNGIERTRETGVMRAIGASDRQITTLVLVEGLLIGVISWILAVILALPVSFLLDYVVGISFIQSPLTFVFSLDGLTVWLIGILIISAVASYLPARNASRLTVREVLAYE